MLCGSRVYTIFMQELFHENKRKLYELLPEKHWAAERMLQECWDNEYYFRVREVYRTQSRQMTLWNKGRKTAGDIVTWTLNSKHTQRLACDLEPLSGDFRPIARIAQKYGITHPISFDKWHFEFDKAYEEPTTVIAIEDRLRALTRGLQRAQRRGLDNAARLLKNTIERLKLRG